MSHVDEAAWDTGVVMSSWGIPFLAGAFLLWPALLRETGGTTRQNRIVQLLFATTFASSINLFILLIFEIAGVLDSSTRFLTWRLLLIVLAALLIFVIPTAFFHTIAVDVFAVHKRTARLLAGVGECVFLWLFWQTGTMFPIMRGGISHDFLTLEGFIGRLGVIGVTTAAILSGYGAISTPYSFVTFFLQDVHLRDISSRKSVLKSTVNKAFALQRHLVALHKQLDEEEGRGAGAAHDASRECNHSEQPPSVYATSASVVPSHVPSLGYDHAREGVAVQPMEDAPPFSKQPSSDSRGHASSSANVNAQARRRFVGSHATPAPTPRPLIRTISSTSNAPPEHSQPHLHTHAPMQHNRFDCMDSWRGPAHDNVQSELKTGGSGGVAAIKIRQRARTSSANGDGPLYAFGKALSQFWGPGLDSNSQLAQVKSDIARTEASIAEVQKIQEELFLEICEMVDVRRRKRYSWTLKGGFYNVLGVALSAWALWKMITNMLNIIFKRVPTTDPITNAFSWILWWFQVPPEQIQMAVQPVSFLVIALMVIISVRGFLLTLGRMFSAWGTGISVNSVALLLAETMGSYFIATVMTMRMSMPEVYRRGVTAAIGEIEFAFLHRWFDGVYVVAACCSIVMFMIVNAVRNSRTSSTDEEAEEVLETMSPTRSADDTDTDTLSSNTPTSEGDRTPVKHRSGSTTPRFGRGASALGQEAFAISQARSHTTSHAPHAHSAVGWISMILPRMGSGKFKAPSKLQTKIP